MIRSRFRDVQSWRVWLGVAIIVLVVIGLATAGGAVWVLNTNWNVSSDRFAALADVLAAGGLALALVAAVVATLAYFVAIEQPDLWAIVRVPNSEINHPVLVIDPTQKVGGEVPYHVIINNAQMYWQVQLENRSAYTARNPVVRIEFFNMSNIRAQGPWLSVTPITEGAQAALRWSGGIDNSVHGNDVADLPRLDMGALFGTTTGEHRVLVYVLAEGFRRVQEFPVQFPTPEAWVKDHPERLQLLPDHLKS